MRLHTIWVDTGSTSEARLYEAWDMYDINENPEGFTAAVAKARIDYSEHRVSVVLMDVESTELSRAINPPEVRARCI